MSAARKTNGGASCMLTYMSASTDRFDEHVRGLNPRSIKTSELLRQYIVVSMRTALEKPAPTGWQEKIREIADEIDRRLPGP